MRNVLILSAALVAALPSAANEADPWNGRDKKMHAAVSAMIGIAARQQYPTEPGKAFLVGAALGLWLVRHWLG